MSRLDRIRFEGLTELEKAAQPLREAGLTVEVDVDLEEDPAKAIVAHAGKYHVDFIAMATHGRSGMGQVVQGSVAAEVLRSGVAPMLLVRPVVD